MRFGKYELGNLIARGGMAEVYAARLHGAEGFVRTVAIKRIREHFSADPEFVRLFIAEARLVAGLHHANIVQIHDFDEVEGSYYLAMELVEGRDLRRLLTRAAEAGRRLSPELGLHVAVEVAKGLMAAHERCADDGRPLGIVHRDLSPHNILVSYAGEVKVTDFGIAKAVSATAGHDTGSDVIRGKVPYMSPEQIRGGDVDQRSDLFSLGLVLFELTTGRRRYEGGASDGLLLKVAEAELPNPAEHNAAISPGLNEVIRRLLAPRPEDRYPSAREALQALRGKGGAMDRSLELGAFVQALYPAEAEAARRGGGRGSTAGPPGASNDLATAPPAAASGRAPESSAAAALAVEGTGERGPREGSDATGLAGAVTAARGGARPLGPWLLGAAALALLVGLTLYLGGWWRRAGADPPQDARSGAASRGPRAVGSAGPAGDARPRLGSPAGPAAGGGNGAGAGEARGAGVGALEIRSEPPGAKVLVDGIPTGRRTPARLGLLPGTHRITARWDDGAEASADAAVEAGARRSLRLRREVRPRRGGARPRPLAVEPPGGRPRVRIVPVASPRELPPPARPPEVASGRPSRVQFTCRPWALVTVGGHELGQTPVGRSLPPGRHQALFRNSSLGRRKAVPFRVRGDGGGLRVDCQF